MKLVEIWNTSRDTRPTRSAENEWRDQVASRPGSSENRGSFADLGRGVFIVTPAGKRLGPFKTPELAASYMENRRDMVPAGSQIKTF